MIGEFLLENITKDYHWLDRMVFLVIKGRAAGPAEEPQALERDRMEYEGAKQNRDGTRESPCELTHSDSF